MYYRIYAKFDGQKTFKALDLSTGAQVNNLIRATVIRHFELEKVKDLVRLNADTCQMQIRDINNNIVKF
jgi:hypothetical protein